MNSAYFEPNIGLLQPNYEEFGQTEHCKKMHPPPQ